MNIRVQEMTLKQLAAEEKALKAANHDVPAVGSKRFKEKQAMGIPMVCTPESLRWISVAAELSARKRDQRKHGKMTDAEELAWLVRCKASYDEMIARRIQQDKDYLKQS